MKAEILKRIERLEKALSPIVYPVLTILEAHRLPDEQRTRYWDGDTTALDIPSYPDLPPGTIHTIVIDLGETGRDVWQQTRGMTDDENESRDEQRINEGDRVELEKVMTASVVAVQYDYSGYPMPLTSKD